MYKVLNSSMNAWDAANLRLEQYKGASIEEYQKKQDKNTYL